MVDVLETIDITEDSVTEDMTKEQLTCKICKAKRLLTDEEIQESIDIVTKHAMKPNGILNIWSALDGDVCPEGGNHDYAWNPAFREKIMNDADKRKRNEVDIVRNNNENEELKNNCDKLERETDVEVEKIKWETEQKIKELTENKDKKVKELGDKIQKNQETNAGLEILNPELETNILKTSGREWKQWL